MSTPSQVSLIYCELMISVHVIFDALSWSSTLSGCTFAFCVAALVCPLLDLWWLTMSSSGISSTLACLLWVVLGGGFDTDPLLLVPDCRFKCAFLGASTSPPSFCRFHEPSRCSSRFAQAFSGIFGTCLVEGRFVSMVEVVWDEGWKLTKF